MGCFGCHQQMQLLPERDIFFLSRSFYFFIILPLNKVFKETLLATSIEKWLNVQEWVVISPRSSFLSHMKWKQQQHEKHLFVLTLIWPNCPWFCSRRSGRSSGLHPPGTPTLRPPPPPLPGQTLVWNLSVLSSVPHNLMLRRPDRHRVLCGHLRVTKGCWRCLFNMCSPVSECLCYVCSLFSWPEATTNCQ